MTPGTGTLLIKNDGKQLFFCSSKCDNNYGLGREAKNVRWTAAGRAERGKK